MFYTVANVLYIIKLLYNHTVSMVTDAILFHVTELNHFICRSLTINHIISNSNIVCVEGEVGLND